MAKTRKFLKKLIAIQFIANYTQPWEEGDGFRRVYFIFLIMIYLNVFSLLLRNIFICYVHITNTVLLYENYPKSSSRKDQHDSKDL